MSETIEIRCTFRRDVGLVERLSLPAAEVRDLQAAIERLRTLCLGRGASLYLSQVPLPTDDGILHIDMGYHSGLHYYKHHQLVRDAILEILGISEPNITWIDANGPDTSEKGN